MRIQLWVSRSKEGNVVYDQFADDFELLRNPRFDACNSLFGLRYGTAKLAYSSL